MLRAVVPRLQAVMMVAALVAALHALPPASAGHLPLEEVLDLGPDGAPRTISTLRFRLPVKTVTITRTVGVPIPVPFPVRHDVPVPVHVHKPVLVPVPQVVHVPYPAPRVVATSEVVAAPPPPPTAAVLQATAPAAPAGILALPVFPKDLGGFGLLVPGLVASLGQHSAAHHHHHPLPQAAEDATTVAATNGHQAGSAVPAASAYGYDSYRPARSSESAVVTVSKSIELGSSGEPL